MEGSAHVDVAVVGGGPIGAVVARCAAEGGASVLLVDRRDDLSRSSCCAGLVSPRTLTTLGVSSDSVLREIRAIIAHAPGGRTLELSTDHAKAMVIDRIRLERELHDLARTAGVDVKWGAEAVSASGNTLVLRSAQGRETVSTSVLIGADGPSSQVAQWAGLPPPEQFVRAAQAVVEVRHAVRSDRVEVFLGGDLAPGFFAWAVPADAKQLRVGLGVTPSFDPAERLDRLLTARFPGCRILSRAGGRIPLSPAPRSAADSVLLVGDAAGQVKPLSGGGLYPGGICARIAGRIAAETALSGGSNYRAAAAYESEWRAAIGREIAFGRSVRRISERLSDPDLNALFAACDDPDLLPFLAEHADIDHFHRLPDELAARPSLWRKVLGLLPVIVSREIADLPDRSSVVTAPRAPL
jgi:digeranylgeranylglycerophospholipid reductase